MEAYIILPPKCIEFPEHSMVKMFLRSDSYVTAYCETQGTWENLFFTVPIIKQNVWRLFFRSRSIHRG